MSRSLNARCEITTTGAILSIDGSDYFQFVNAASKQWLKARCTVGFHEPMMSELLIRFLLRHPDSTFADIGSLYGYFGLLALTASRSKARVYTFEMNPDSFSALKQNIAANTHLQLERISAVHSAVGDVDSAAQEVTYRGFLLNSTEPGARRAAIPFLTLDRWCRDHQVRPDLIKIDVEGYEGKVLKGASEVMKSYNTVIMLELHSNVLLESSCTTRSDLLLSLLRDGHMLYYFGRHRKDTLSGAIFVSTSYVEENRTTFDSTGDELVLISRTDIREFWPELRITSV